MASYKWGLCRVPCRVREGLGSRVVISGGTSPLIWVITIATLLITPLP